MAYPIELKEGYIVEGYEGGEYFIGRVTTNDEGYLVISSENVWVTLEKIGVDYDENFELGPYHFMHYLTAVYGRTHAKLSWKIDTEERKLLWKKN